MPEAQEKVSTLEDALRDPDDLLRERYAEFVPCEATNHELDQDPNPFAPAGKKARRHPLNPDRVLSKAEQAGVDSAGEFLAGSANGTMLHGAKPPPIVIQQERPEHRFLIFLYAQGLSTKEIYIQLGGEWDSTRNAPISGSGQYSYQHLHTIRRQAWFQTKLVEYMEQCGKDVVKAKFEAELMPSIDRVISIRDDANAPVAVQLRAAESLIDRFLGKAAITVVQQTPSSVARYEKEVAELEAESLALTAQINSLNPSFLANQ